MASALTDKLSRLVKEIRGQARITESNVADMLREVRMALLEADGWTVHRLPVDTNGRIHADAVPEGPIGLGTLILAQNETGTIQPVAQFAERVHAAGGVIHTDAAQAVGKINVQVDELGVDLLSIAGHKLYAPKGVGALYVRRGTTIRPLLVGASQEHGLRPGTENVASIVGLGRAAELAGTQAADCACSTRLPSGAGCTAAGFFYRSQRVTETVRSAS